MKKLTNRSVDFSRVRSCWSLLIGSAFLYSAQISTAQNMGVLLADGDDEFSYGTAVANGVSGAPQVLPTNPSAAMGGVSLNWNIGTAGQPGPRTRYATVGNWFYRFAGDGRERVPANLSLVQSATNYARYEFNPVGPSGSILNDVVGVMDFLLVDTGPQSSLLSTNLCFYNLGQNHYMVDTFLAMNLDLNGSPSTNLAMPTQIGPGRKLRFVDGADIGLMYMPTGIGSGVELGNTPFSRFGNSMMDSYVPDVNAFGFGPGDLTGVCQSAQDLPAGSSVCTPMYVGIGQGIEPPLAVPEPATGLMLMGGLGFLISRRRGQNRRQ